MFPMNLYSCHIICILNTSLQSASAKLFLAYLIIEPRFRYLRRWKGDETHTKTFLSQVRNLKTLNVIAHCLSWREYLFRFGAPSTFGPSISILTTEMLMDWDTSSGNTIKWKMEPEQSYICIVIINFPI